MGKAALFLTAIVLALGLAIGFWVVGQYNGLIARDEAVATQWAHVETVYQRRADLVPNLVSTVRGAAEFEQDTLNQVIEARSRVGQVSIEAGADVLSDPAAFARFQQAQDGLSSALSRLLVVVERYPELRAVEAFQDLMTQLEGTENRISVARVRFNEAARDFNVGVRRFPTAWLVSALGWPFSEKEYFSSQPGAETAPTVDLSLD